MFDDKYLTVNDVADLLQVSTSWIRQLVFRDKIPYIKVGKIVRFRRCDLEKWIRESHEDSEGVL